MKMVKVLLTDGSIKLMKVDEFKKASMDDLMRIYNGKKVVDVQFYDDENELN